MCCICILQYIYSSGQKNVAGSAIVHTVCTLAVEHELIANANKHRPFRSVSFPAVVYWARQQGLYCGMGASATGSTV